METAIEFLQKSKSAMLQHPFLSCDFVENMAAAKPLSLEQAQVFARYYYPHILRTRLYQACAMGITPDEKIQSVFAEILYDEYGNGDLSCSHMQLYRNFMLAVDESPALNPDEYLLPSLKKYIDDTYALVQRGPWIAAVGAVGIASEWPIPEFYKKILSGLQTVPNISATSLELFSGHIELDLVHSQRMGEALLPHLCDSESRDQFAMGIEQNLSARHQFLDELNEIVFPCC